MNRLLDRYIPRADLRKVHPDHHTARELCLILLSNFSNTFEVGQWKRLSSEILRRQVHVKPNTYVQIIALLKKGSERFGGVIQVNDHYSEHLHVSKQYALTDRYFAKGFEPYRLRTEVARKLRNQEFFRCLKAAHDNTIAKNLLGIYGEVMTPTVEEVRERAKRLVAEGYYNKKGKKLTFLHRHDRTRWKDVEERTFVEENIELYKILTSEGYFVPSISSEKAGGRVIDSFCLMPSWIRSMTTIDGVHMEEVDYSALHPNIALKIYGGHAHNITHQGIAKATGIDLAKVKVEHLSFFNKEWIDMTRSPLFEFYCTTEPEMMEAIYQDKAAHGHKITSQHMFTMEVEMMTTAIENLNEQGIHVLYVYDALMCEPRHKEAVRSAMNVAAILHGVATTAK